MQSLISWVLTASATAASGIILFVLQRFLSRLQKKEEMRDMAKARESALVLRSLTALGKLTVANSLALRDGYAGEDLAVALGEYRQIEREMVDHLINIHAQNGP